MPRNLYKVTGRGRAGAIFRQGRSITIDYDRTGSRGQVTLSTRYLDRGFGVDVPGDFTAEVDGEAETADEAASIWVTVARELSAIVSVGCNAAIAPLNVELAYEVTSGKTEREFLQRFYEADEVCLSSRIIRPDVISSFISSVAFSRHRERLLRAIAQYNEALLRWGLGNELLVVAHSWMGIEALKKACLRHELEKTAVPKEELAKSWGFTAAGGYMEVDSFLDMQARQRLVFRGDLEIHRAAKQVSDGFEHGFEDAGTLIPLARRVMIVVAQ